MVQNLRLATGLLLFLALVAGCARAQPRPSGSPFDENGRVLPAPAIRVDTPAPGSEPMPPLPPDFQLPVVEPRTPRGVSIGLLLPLSGSYAATGEAVRDGFLAATFKDPARGEVRVYDVGSSDAQLLGAYQRALDEGAAILVGPLRKESVAYLASLRPPVPVLALNYLDAASSVPFNFLQMGLAPEDEARAAADHANRLGLRRAIAMVPGNEWGERTLAAFEQQLRAEGGAVLRSERYTPGVADHSKAIEALLGVAASEERHRALTAILGVKSQFEAKRRSDIDLIFLAARAPDARLLVPQFRFARVGDAPIYATALAYSGRGDSDRAGLRFCDMPWVVGDTTVWAPARLEVEALASAGTQPRLHALGRDAYQLSAGLLRGELRPGDRIDGATGRLSWGSSGQIERALDCVQIQSDGLRALP
ncbi:MAG TPA: penicillin-binding protein activator [Solimonas sp.]|nr:penicillin-binding protein activator [Solimonas sp.]